MTDHTAKTERDKGTVKTIHPEEGYGILRDNFSGAMWRFELADWIASGHSGPVPGQVINLQGLDMDSRDGWVVFNPVGRIPAPMHGRPATRMA